MSEVLNSDNNHENNDEEVTKWESLKNVKFDPEKASRLKLASAGNTFGEGRDDRSVSVASPEGEYYKSSSIMFGRTGRGEGLNNGTYISADDIRAQIDAELAGSEDGQLVDTSYEPPRAVSADEAMAGILSDARRKGDGINLTGVQVNNANGKRLEVVNGDGETRASSVLIFNKEVEISDGEYISENSVKEALNNYMIGTEAPVKAMASNTSSEKSFKLSKKIGAIVLGVLILFSLTRDGKVDATDNIHNPFSTNQIEQTIGGVADDAVNQTIEENQSEGIQIGDKYSIPNTVAHESSDYQYGGKDNTANLDDGEYDVQGFSVQNPVTHEIVDSSWEEGKDLNEFIEENANEMSAETGQNITSEDLQSGTKIHVGRNNTEGQQQIGWVDYDDIVNNGVEGGNNG